jgi:signal peptidase II
VIDFLDFRVWPVFNIADSAITVGVVILVLKILFSRPLCIRSS